MAAFYKLYPFSVDDEVTVPSYEECWIRTEGVICEKIDDKTYRVRAKVHHHYSYELVYPVHIDEIKIKKPLFTASKEFYKKHKKLKKHMNEYGKYNNILIFHCSAIRDNFNCSRKSIKDLTDNYYKYLPIAHCIDE